MKQKKKRNATLITLAVFILGAISNFLFGQMPDNFKQILTDFAEKNIGISYSLFWFLGTAIVIIITLFFVWRQALSEQQGHVDEILQAVNHPKIPHALTPDPVFPQLFIGRDAELKQLREKLLSGDNFLLLVNGKGGMGKTTLAAKYYLTYKNEYQHVAWLSSEKSIANALLSLRFTLGIEDEYMLPDERMKLLLTKLANLKKPSLMVIQL